MHPFKAGSARAFRGATPGTAPASRTACMRRGLGDDVRTVATACMRSGPDDDVCTVADAMKGTARSKLPGWIQ